MSGELIETSESSRTHDRGKPHQFVKSHERINIGKLLISAFQKKSEKVKFLAGYNAKCPFIPNGVMPNGFMPKSPNLMC